MSNGDIIKEWYTSYRDGKLWCESVDPFEVINQSQAYECTYTKTIVKWAFSSKTEEWIPVAGEL